MPCPAMVFCTSEEVGDVREVGHCSPGPPAPPPPHLLPSPIAPFVFSSLRDPKAMVGRRQAK